MDYEKLLAELLEKYPDHAREIEKAFQSRADYREDSLIANGINILLIKQLDEKYAKITGRLPSIAITPQTTDNDQDEELSNSDIENKDNPNDDFIQ